MFACKHIQLPSPSVNASTSPEGRGFKYCVYQHLKALRARRVKQTVQWTVCSQSGEQFIIATRGFKPGTQSR